MSTTTATLAAPADQAIAGPEAELLETERLDAEQRRPDHQSTDQPHLLDIH